MVSHEWIEQFRPATSTAGQVSIGRPYVGTSTAWVFLLGLLTLLANGCEFAELPPDAKGAGHRSAASRSVVDRPLILSTSALRYRFLLPVKGSFRWRFDEQTFVVESWNDPLPQSLVAPVLGLAADI